MSRETKTKIQIKGKPDVAVIANNIIHCLTIDTATSTARHGKTRLWLRLQNKPQTPCLEKKWKKNHSLNHSSICLKLLLLTPKTNHTKEEKTNVGLWKASLGSVQVKKLLVTFRAIFNLLGDHEIHKTDLATSYNQNIIFLFFFLYSLVVAAAAAVVIIMPFLS